MLNRIWTWISAHRHFSIGLGLIMFLVFLYILTIGSCSSSPAASSSAPGGGYFFWKILLIGLIIAAVVSRDRLYLASIFSGLAVLIFLVILGKFDGLFAWAVLGLPLFAAAGIWGYTKTDGRTKEFLGFASCALIIFWMFLMYLGHKNLIQIGFLKSLFPIDPADGLKGNLPKILCTLAILSFVIAWLFGSKPFYVITLVVSLSFLGNAVVNPIFKQFPDKLTPTVSKDTKDTWENTWKALLDSVNRAVKPSATEKNIRSSIPTPTDNVYARINPLLDIDISASKEANPGNNDIVVAPGGHATFKFYVSNPPSGTERNPVDLMITLKPSACKYLHYTINGKRYTAFLSGFGRKRLGLTSDILTDINTLEFEGDGELIINAKEVMTFAKS